jgi:hypothetical protein
MFGGRSYVAGPTESKGPIDLQPIDCVLHKIDRLVNTENGL